MIECVGMGEYVERLCLQSAWGGREGVRERERARESERASELTDHDTNPAL